MTGSKTETALAEPARDAAGHDWSWVWTAAMAVMLVLGGSNWSMPLTRFLAQLVSAGLLIAAIAAGNLPRGSGHGVHLAMPDKLWLALLGLFALHLLPMPPALWSQLPARELAAATDRAVFGALRWRPLSLDPQASWRSLLMLLPPFAVYLAARLGNAARLQALLRGVVLAAGIAFAAAFAQQMLPSAEWLRFYPRGDYPLPIGFFSNRNHQATFLLCAIPMAAAWWRLGQHRDASSRAAAGWPVAVFAALAAIAALITASRSGAALLPLALVGTATAWFAARDDAAGPAWLQRRRLGRWGAPMAAAAGLLVLGALMLGLGDTELARPLNRAAAATDQRFAFWPLVVSAAAQFWPMGSGIGTFLEGYEMFEPLTSLSPLYLNHAHNDFLEIALETGVPGLVLALVATWELAVLGWRAWRCGNARSLEIFTARMASVALLLPVLHSLVDYPLRTVAISCVAALAGAMLVPGSSRPAARLVS